MRLTFVYIVLFIFVRANSQTSDMIILKHCGVQDKPFDPIVIAETKTDTTGLYKKTKYLEKHNLGHLTFIRLDSIYLNDIENLIRKFQKENGKKLCHQCKKNKKVIAPYGSFKVDLYSKKSNLLTLLICDKTESYNLISIIKVYLEKFNIASSEIQQIEYLISRLK